jgi:hypothetical protein
LIRRKLYSTDHALIAPCGIDCCLCQAYARDKNPCPGCREEDAGKSQSCLACRIKNCEKLTIWKLEYCFDCADFPCPPVTHLDKRYRTKYAASPIKNLLCIKENGIIGFIRNENEKWTCPRCGAMLCMHKPQCLSCGYLWHK